MLAQHTIRIHANVSTCHHVTRMHTYGLTDSSTCRTDVLGLQPIGSNMLCWGHMSHVQNKKCGKRSSSVKRRTRVDAGAMVKFVLLSSRKVKIVFMSMNGSFCPNNSRVGFRQALQAASTSASKAWKSTYKAICNPMMLLGINT